MSNRTVVYHVYPNPIHILPVPRYTYDHWDYAVFENHQQGNTKWWRRYPDSSSPYYASDMNDTTFIDHEFGIPSLDDWHNGIHRVNGKIICYGINTFVDRTSPLSHLNPLVDLVNAVKVHVSADLYPSQGELDRSNGVDYRVRVQRRKDLLKYVQHQTKQMPYQVVSPVHPRTPNSYRDGILLHTDWIQEQVNNIDTTMGTVVFAAAGSDNARKIIDPAIINMMALVDAKYATPTNTTTNGNGRMF